MNYSVILPCIISFVVCVILCPLLIPFLKKLKFGQYVRDDGPETHLKKSGTPTMGGIVIVLSIAITSLIYIKDIQILCLFYLQPSVLELSVLWMIT